MANRRLRHFLYHRLVVPIIGGALSACGQTSGGGLFQPGQIVGGGTKEIRDGQCELRRSWYAHCVGGAAARVGRSSPRLLCCPALTERAAKERSGSAKLTMPSFQL